MVHDQLAAAGAQATIDVDLSSPRLLAAIEQHAPDVLVIGVPTHPTPPSAVAAIERLLEELRESHPNLPVLLASTTAGAAPPELQRALPGVPVLQHIDGAVPVVEELMTAREHALG